MTAQRLLLFGADSQVGQAVAQLFEQKRFPQDWTLHAPNLAQCDITNPSALRQTIQSLAPNLILNTAELDDIVQAEKDELRATAINFHAVAHMAAHCSMMDIPLIHLSTALVFDGRKNAPYTPDDPMNPLSTYGGSKMMGEEALRHELAWHVIVRSSAVFSARPSAQNPLLPLLDQMKNGESLRLPADRVVGPTYAPDLAQAILAIAGELLAGKADGYGTFHFCGAEAVSLYDFGCAVRDRVAFESGQAPSLTAIMSSETDTLPRSPLRTALECSKIKERYGILQPDWREGLREAIATRQNTKDR